MVARDRFMTLYAFFCLEVINLIYYPHFAPFYIWWRTTILIWWRIWSRRRVWKSKWNMNGRGRIYRGSPVRSCFVCRDWVQCDRWRPRRVSSRLTLRENIVRPRWRICVGSARGMNRRNLWLVSWWPSGVSCRRTWSICWPATPRIRFWLIMLWSCWNRWPTRHR